MGYYTRFEIEIIEDPDNIWEREIEAVAEKALTDYDYENIPLMMLGGHDDTYMKWYDYAKDMKKLSDQYPSVLFGLSGEGEEPGDLWKLWARNGKVIIAKARITFDTPNLELELPRG